MEERISARPKGSMSGIQPVRGGGVDRLGSICVYAGSNSNKGEKRNNKMGETKEERGREVE